MPIQAEYNGKTYTFPDNTSEDDIYKHLNSMATQPTEQAPQAPQEAPEQPQDGSMLDTITSNWKRLGENAVAGFADDPNLSNYARRKAVVASKEYQSNRSKLGTVSGFAADMVGMAPQMIASAVAPEAAPLIWGATGTSEALAQQQEAGQDYDTTAATLAGGAGAALGAAGGMGGKALGTSLAGKVASPFLQRAAQEAGEAAGMAGGTAGQQAMTNLAVGRDWHEGLGEAAGMGLLTHGVVKGSLAGLNKAMDIPLNKGGQDAIQANTDFENQTGLKVNPTWSQNAAEFSNLYSHENEALKNLPAGESSAPVVSNLVDVSMHNGTPKAVQDMTKLMQMNNQVATPAWFDLDINKGFHDTGDKVNLAKIVGISDDDITHSGEALYGAKAPLFGRTKARLNSETTESARANAQEAYNKSMEMAHNSAEYNHNLVTTKLKEASIQDLDPTDVEKLKQLKTDLGLMKEMSANAVKGDSPDADVLETTSKRILSSAHDLGLYDQLKGVTGDKGDYNPVTNLQTILLYRKGAARMDPSIAEGRANEFKSEHAGETLGTLGTEGAVIAATHGAALPIVLARRGVSEFQKALGRRKLREATSHARDVTNALASGDSEAAATASSEALQASGINPGENPIKPIEGLNDEPVQTPVQEEPVQPEVEPEVAPEAENASTVTPEEVAQRARAPRQIPEATEARPLSEEELASAKQAKEDILNRAARKPQQKAPEAEVEQPQAEEPQAATEAPEAPEQASKEKVDFETLVKKPIKAKMEEFNKTPRSQTTEELARANSRNKRVMKEVDSEVNRYVEKNDGDANDVWEEIHRAGGIDRVTQGNLSVRDTINNLMKKAAERKSEEAERDSKAAEAMTDEVTSKETSPEALEKARTDFRAKGVKDDVFTEADKLLKERLGEDAQPTRGQFTSVVRDILRQRAEAAKAAENSVKSGKTATVKPAEVRRTIGDTRQDLHGYAIQVGMEHDPEITKLIARETRALNDKSPALSDAAVRRILNKMHERIDSEIENYEKALSKPETAQPVQLARWRAQLAKLKNGKQNIATANDRLKSKLDARMRKVEAAQKAEEDAKAKTTAESEAATKLAKEAEEVHQTHKQEAAETRNATVEKLREAMKDESPAQAAATVQKVISDGPSDLGSTDSKAYHTFEIKMNASEKILRDKGKVREADAVKHQLNVIKKGLEMKEQYPDNPELWVSKDDMVHLNSLFGKEGEDVGSHTFVGTMGIRIRLAIFGMDSGAKKFIDFSDSTIKSKIRALKEKKPLEEGGINAFGIKD